MRGTMAHTKRRVLTARPGTSPAAQLLCPRVAKQLHPSFFFFQNILIFLPPSHSFWRANWGAVLPAMLLGAAGRATQLPPPGLAISRQEAGVRPGWCRGDLEWWWCFGSSLVSGSLSRSREVKAGISHPTPGVGRGLQWGSLQVALQVG